MIATVIRARLFMAKGMIYLASLEIDRSFPIFYHQIEPKIPMNFWDSKIPRHPVISGMIPSFSHRSMPRSFSCTSPVVLTLDQGTKGSKGRASEVSWLMTSLNKARGVW